MAELWGIAQAVLVLALGSVILHTAWCVYCRNTGQWNPENYRYWLWFPWRPLARWYISLTEWRRNELLAGGRSTAQWGGFLGRLVLVFKPGDVLLGGFGFYGFRLFQPLGMKAQRHLAMVAGTGTGKTTLLITMLGLHPGNAFVVDPKGQITRIIARRRGQGGNGVRGLGKNVAILDPYKLVEGHPRACWNPLDELTRVEARESRDGVVKYAMKMAEGLVPMDGDKPYFPKTAREFLQGLILHVYTSEPPERRHIVRVRDLLARGYADEMRAEGASAEEINNLGFKALLHEMQGNPAFDGAIANAGATMANTGKSFGDVLSTARSALKCFDIPEIRAISRSSDFSLHDLKSGNQDLFIVAPAGDIRSDLANWFRLLSVVALDLFEKIPGNLETPTLFAIDEMPSLGYIEAVATAAPLMRGFGVRLLAITQDLKLLEKAYPKDWQGFLGNADAVYWMGTNEAQTGQYLSEYLGKRTLYSRERPWRPWAFWRLFNQGKRSAEDRWLLTPDQVMKILAPEKENMIITRFGRDPIRVKTMPYFRELPVYFYDPDPDHREAPARAQVRATAAAGGGSFFAEAKALFEEIRAPVTPASPAIEMPYDQALQLFNVREPFTLSDLNTRRRMLDWQSADNPHYGQVIERAHDVLRERAEL